MILYKKKHDLQTKIAALKKEGKTIGFVPTMGALHAGHLSLVKACLRENDVAVCSLFVNPTQFNDSNDFSHYPVTLESDIQMLTEAGNTLLFLPSVEEIYPDGKLQERYNLGLLETWLEGQYRPGHFQGVCQVVNRLFNIIQPHKAYFGQKDYQQCLVIKKLVALTAAPVEIIVLSTLREKSGLAMSSRNMRLTQEQKQTATALYKALLFIKEDKLLSPLPLLLAEARKRILAAGFATVDYIDVREAKNLAPISSVNESEHAVALVAAFIGGVRLIDNLLL